MFVTQKEQSSMLSSADVDLVCDILREEASFADENGVEYIDFEGMTHAQDRCRDLWGSELDRCFRPTTFLKLRGLGGAVEVDVLVEYTRRYVEMRRLVRPLVPPSLSHSPVSLLFATSDSPQTHHHA